MTKKIFKSLFFEGIMYACAWQGASILLSYPVNLLMSISEDASIWILNLGLWSAWILSSLLFSFYKGEPSWQMGTLKYMFVGVLNMGMIYLMFWAYTLNREWLDEQGFEVVGMMFMWIWNALSAGSDHVVVSVFTLILSLMAVVVVLALVTFGLNAFFYMLTKPAVDQFFAKKTS